MAEDLNEYRLAVENIKARLKEMKITYAELADGIGMSESGVKKIFTGSDGSFQRLAQICKYAGISLSEILDSESRAEGVFSAEQQSAFLKEPEIFQLYWLLAYERRSLIDVENFLRLTKADSARQLQRLEQLGLLKVLAGQRLRLPSVEALQLNGDGPFMRKILQDWSQRFIAKMAKPSISPNEFFSLRYLRMRSETYDALIKAQKELETDFLKRAAREMKSGVTDLQHVRWLSAMDDESFVQD